MAANGPPSGFRKDPPKNMKHLPLDFFTFLPLLSSQTSLRPHNTPPSRSQLGLGRTGQRHSDLPALLRPQSPDLFDSKGDLPRHRLGALVPRGFSYT